MTTVVTKPSAKRKMPMRHKYLSNGTQTIDFMGLDAGLLIPILAKWPKKVKKNQQLKISQNKKFNDAPYSNFSRHLSNRLADPESFVKHHCLPSFL